MNFPKWLFMMFVYLKLTDQIYWSWWWVWAPLIFEMFVVLMKWFVDERQKAKKKKTRVPAKNKNLH